MMKRGFTQHQFDYVLCICSLEQNISSDIHRLYN